MNRSPRNPQTSTLAEILADPTTEWAEVREAIKSQGRGSFFGATTNASVIKALREHSAASNNETPERRTSSSCTTVVTSNEENGGCDDDFSGRLRDGEKEANCGVVAGDGGCSHEIEVANMESSDDGSAPENPSHAKHMDINDAVSSGDSKGSEKEGCNGSVAIKTDSKDSSEHKEVKVDIAKPTRACNIYWNDNALSKYMML